VTGAETQLLLARALVLILLYTFLGGIAVLAWLDLRQTRVGRAESAQVTTGARCIVLDGAGSGRPAGAALPLATVSSVGRDLDNELILADATVSGRHAVVLRRDGVWWVEDLASTNGTFVNGSPVDPALPALLRSGDVVQFGAVRLRLVSPEGA
jgi:eukaryotic-like serine/threonine-protein kinase